MDLAKIGYARDDEEPYFCTNVYYNIDNDLYCYSKPSLLLIMVAVRAWYELWTLICIFYSSPYFNQLNFRCKNVSVLQIKMILKTELPKCNKELKITAIPERDLICLPAIQKSVMIRPQDALAMFFPERLPF